jgi:glycosyltransferase involved in cell wall biosynthesis
MKGIPDAGLNPAIPVIRAWSVNRNRINLQGRSAGNILISLSFSLSLMAILFRKRRMYDIAHFHGASLPLLLNIIPLGLMGKKIVAKVAGAKMDIEAGSFRGRYLFFGNIMASMMRRVDAFIAISREIREDLISDGIPPERIHDISNFISYEEFHPPAEAGAKRLMKRTLLGAERPVLLFAGRLVRTKRLDLLLEALRCIRDAGQKPLLVILGDGELRDHLADLALGMGLAEEVMFRGTVGNVRDYLHAADIFVFPSEREGMPNAVIEAMACGLPVVAAKAGGVPDLIIDGENGLLFDTGDAAQLRDAVLRLLEDGLLREALGQRALDTILEGFTVGRASERYGVLYERLVGTE